MPDRANSGIETGPDVAADAFAWAWEYWDEVRAMANPVGYLYRVGQSAARRHRRWGRVAWCSPQNRGRRDAVVRAGARRAGSLVSVLRNVWLSSWSTVWTGHIRKRRTFWACRRAACATATPDEVQRITAMAPALFYERDSGASFGASSAPIFWNRTFEGFDGRLGSGSS